ncbi:MAG: ATP-binding protein [Methanomicrobiales archaeon]|nr:ATP-binding protein [Methanomicrobiales archaeon]MDI6877474.1 ATP-binding protein [Methanomicrobiales archaeon]
MRILVIEDNPADVALIHELLWDHPSFQFVHAGDLASALTLLHRGGIGFILLDLGLPDSQGVDTVRTVKMHAPDIPLVVLTGLDDEETGVHALQEGAQDYLVKGQMSGASLVRSIRYADERNRIEQELVSKNQELNRAYDVLAANEEELRNNLDELQKAERALRESENRLKKAQEIAHFGSWEMDSARSRLTLSDEACRILGVSPREFDGSYAAFLDRVHPEDGAAVDAAYRGGEREGVLEHRIVRRSDGRIRFVREKWETVRDDRGGASRILGTIHDITEQKQAERTLLAQRELLRAIVDTVPVMLTYYDPHLGRFLVNNEFRSVLGWSEDDVAEGDLLVRSAVPQDREIAVHLMQSEDPGWHELSVAAKDGSPVESSWTTMNLFDGTRLLVGIDIRDRMRTEKVLKEYADNLKRSNEDLERFAYVASHDLQEPLRNIKNYAQLLARRYSDRLDPDADEFIGYIVEGTTRMQALILDLLEFSRIASRGQPFRPTQPGEILGAVTDSLRLRIEDVGAEIVHDPLPTVMADATQLSQVFQNLLENALKFRREGVPPRVHIAARQDGGEWVFSVADNGIGIEPQYFDRIFTIFQRLHHRSQYPGTGIGLSICKRIVERHGGRIWVESEPGVGSTFFFTLPSVARTEGVEETPPEQHRPAPENARDPRIRQLRREE